MGSVTPAALQVIKAAATLNTAAEQQRPEDPLGGHGGLAAIWRMGIGALPSRVFEAGDFDSGYVPLRDGFETLGKGTIEWA